jgi:hypothetical protein
LLEKPNGKITYANKRAIELHGKNPCGIEKTKPILHLKIYSLDGNICPTTELYTYRALFKEETIRDNLKYLNELTGHASL